MKTIPEPARDVPVVWESDVCVVRGSCRDAETLTGAEMEGRRATCRAEVPHLRNEGGSAGYIPAREREARRQAGIPAAFPNEIRVAAGLPQPTRRWSEAGPR